MSKTNLGRVLLGLPGLFILLSGLVFLLAPERAAAKLLLDPQGIDGLSNLRGFVGAPVLAVGISILMSAITQKLEYARPGVFFLFGLIFARLLSFAVDGPAEAFALYLTVPVVAFALMALGHKLMVAEEAPAVQPSAA